MPNKTSSDNNETTETKDCRNLIVNYIPTAVKEPALYELFSPFGDIVDCRIICDRKTGAPKGYGFVTFSTMESSKKAMETLNGYPLGGKRLKVTPADGNHSREIIQYLCARQEGRSTSSTFRPRFTKLDAERAGVNPSVSSLKEQHQLHSQHICPVDYIDPLSHPVTPQVPFRPAPMTSLDVISTYTTPQAFSHSSLDGSYSHNAFNTQTQQPQLSAQTPSPVLTVPTIYASGWSAFPQGTVIPVNQPSLAQHLQVHPQYAADLRSKGAIAQNVVPYYPVAPLGSCVAYLQAAHQGTGTTSNTLSRPS